jgi:D-alanine--poly(phosphoribitol) ligase subunit 1
LQLNSSHNVNKNFQEPLAVAFLKNISMYSCNNALWINEHYYTYNELWQLVYSIHQQIPTDKIYDRIGVYCNDDVYTYAGILAVSLYGAAYVPLNNKFPIAKNKRIVEECGLELILTSVESEALNLIFGKAGILLIRHFKPDSESTNETLHVVQNDTKKQLFQKIDQPTAYILFTSGSTGEPKGVPVSHSNANYFFDFFLKNYDFNQEDKFLQVYELTFDVSVFSFFMPLYVGACCYVLPNDGIKFVKILQLLERHKITVISMVPTVLRYVEKYLKEVKFLYLRYSFFSGDTLYHHLATAWSNAVPNAKIYNFYGPTETTIVCTRYIFDEKKSAEESINGIVPLGKTFDGMEALIVDKNNQVTEKGELCFSGTQVISGYLNGRNESKFFNYQDKRYYKTGDIASLNTNKNFVFYGRTDSQVKINGYRIELGEVESVIEKIINAKCVVVCTKDEKEINTLTAFIESIKINENELKTTLASLLPDYMIPQKLIIIERLPLNLNGKVDKNKLLTLKE